MLNRAPPLHSLQSLACKGPWWHGKYYRLPFLLSALVSVVEAEPTVLAMLTCLIPRKVLSIPVDMPTGLRAYAVLLINQKLKATLPRIMHQLDISLIATQLYMVSAIAEINGTIIQNLGVLL